MRRTPGGLTLRTLNPVIRLPVPGLGYDPAYAIAAAAASGGQGMAVRSHWAGLITVCLLTGTPVFAAIMTPKPSAAASAADCAHLLAQFDVAWNSHRVSARADAAHRTRDLGEAACHEGRFSDGVHQLKRALHDLGLKPVRRPSGSISH
jgi:hypothetical protein